MTPASATIGEVITLTGSNLSQATIIAFTGNTANLVTAGFTVNSAGTQITNITVPSGAVTGPIRVTTPGGLSNGVPFSVLAPVLTAYHLQQQGVRTSRVDLHHQAPGAIKVGADGAAGTLFSVARSTGTHFKLRLQENPTNSRTGALADAAGYLDTLTTATAAEAMYYHPSFVVATGWYKDLHLEVVDKGTGTVLGTYLVQAVRPPLLLVHGLWSNGPDAFPDLPLRLVTDGVYSQQSDIRYARYDNDRDFLHNAPYIINDKNALLRSYADRNISVSKIDVIGHSMGGLLARQYIQSSSYQQDINKLITLNTPHSGSPIPNFINSLSAVPRLALVEDLMFLGKDPTKGAVDDLNYSGLAPGTGVARLNIAPNTHGVVVHATTTTFQLSPLLPVSQLINGNLSWGGVIMGFVSLAYPRSSAAFNTFLSARMFQSPGNDCIVGLDSQQGGLTGAYTDNTPGQWHGSGGNSVVQTQLITLLKANSRSTSFSTAGFRPVPIHSVFPRAATPIPAPPAKTASTLVITSPTRNTVLTDVDSIQVAVSASSDVTRIMLVCGTGTDELTSKLITGAGGTTYIKVPKGGLGRLKLAAFAFADSVFVQHDTLGTGLTTRATLTRVRLEPRLAYTSAGDSALVQVFGTYSDGLDRNVLGQPGMQFTFRSGGKARMGRRNRYIIGLSTGLDSLRVTFAGRTDIVPVVVAAPQMPVLATRPPTPEPLSVWPNPAQHSVRIRGASNVPISLLDMLGRPVRTHAPLKPTQEAVLDLRGLPTGLYIVRAGTASKRLFVE
ncbi:PGAP1-like alpha/beta domain-containing protein [Hymenobacter jeollabukensis]|uniref:PGAP1-like alpha/beta domain-containing protein n=1 Tax=Hymenobacter jeollabukensis TaxID=2025313 RepID=UPI0014850F91|nr:T9SS type A sorting domain-containing protein [Hymenobacter jeollabukensis]